MPSAPLLRPTFPTLPSSTLLRLLSTSSCPRQRKSVSRPIDVYQLLWRFGYVFAADEGKTYTLKAKIKAVPGETDSRYIAKLQMFTDGDDQNTKFMLSDYNALPEETDAKYGYTYKTLTAQFTATLNADYKPVFIYGGKAGELHNAAVTFYGMEIYDGDTLLDYYDNAAKAVDAGDVNLLEDEAGPYWSYVYGVVDPCIRGC